MAGSGSVTILWKEPGVCTGKWAVVRLGDAQPVVRKAEMIETLRQGDATPAKAWLLKYEDDEWRRTDQQITLYGDQGFRGVAFGRMEAVDAGDQIDVYFAHAARRWYGVVGGWDFYGDVVEDIPEGAEGEAKLNVGAGADAGEITVQAFSPYGAVKKDDFVSVDRQHDQRPLGHRQVHRRRSRLRTGARRRLRPQGLEPGPRRAEACSGGRLRPGGRPRPRCGITATGGIEVAVPAANLAAPGLVVDRTCGLAVNPGCGT